MQMKETTEKSRSKIHPSAQIKYIGRRMKAHIVRLTRVMVLIAKPAERTNGSSRDTKKDRRWTEGEKWMNNCPPGQSACTDWVAPRELAIIQQTGEQWECHIMSITKSGIYICMIRPQESPNERSRSSRSRHVNLWCSQIVAVVSEQLVCSLLRLFLFWDNLLSIITQLYVMS